MFAETISLLRILYYIIHLQIIWTSESKMNKREIKYPISSASSYSTSPVNFMSVQNSSNWLERQSKHIRPPYTTKTISALINIWYGADAILPGLHECMWKQLIGLWRYSLMVKPVALSSIRNITSNSKMKIPIKSNFIG